MHQATPFSLSPLSRGFVGAKPIEFAPDSLLEGLEARHDLLIERKRNGHAGYVTLTGARRRTRIYSRGINELTANFPHLVEGLRNLRIPEETLLAGEMFVQAGGIDSPEIFSRFARSKREKSLALQREYAPVHLALFNVIVYRGTSVVHYPYADRLDMLEEMAIAGPAGNVRVVDVLNYPFACAKEMSIAGKWEGLVLYDRKAGSEYRLDGRIDQTPRPEGVWKWKDYLEGDFVATGWIPSTASSHTGCVKDLTIAQYDRKRGELVDWGRIGVGLSKQDRIDYMNDALYPMVFEIKFERRTANNRLIHGRIMRRRLDKAPRECITPEF